MLHGRSQARSARRVYAADLAARADRGGGKARCGEALRDASDGDDALSCEYGVSLTEPYADTYSHTVQQKVCRAESLCGTIPGLQTASRSL
jgi:hypothetical protein